MVSVFGAKQTDISELSAGDIGAVTKLGGFATGVPFAAPRKW